VPAKKLNGNGKSNGRCKIHSGTATACRACLVQGLQEFRFTNLRSGLRIAAKKITALRAEYAVSGLSKRCLPLFFVALTVSGCSQDRWEGYVYPNQQDLTRHLYVGEFESLEACRDVATAKLDELGALSRGDYECGKNCRTEPGLTVRICEETLR